MGARGLDALLVRIANGDNAAFEEFYIKTKRGVYAFLHTYFHNAADTEDAMQSVYLNVKKGIANYRAGSNGRAWLLQIAKNLALNELKKRKREIVTAEIELPVAEYTGISVTDIMERVLTEEEQRIVALHVLWGYKHREIADILGCPTGTVTSKYKRAIEKLRKSLKEETPL